MIAALIFWFSVLGLGYIFVFYPLIIHALARTKKASSRHHPGEATAQHFDVLMASHHEGKRVQEKAEEVWMAGATLGLRRIVIVLDGHDAEAEEALRAWTPFGGELNGFEGEEDLTDYGVIVVGKESRVGKPACLTIGIAQCTSEWVVMMDVRQKMGTNCLQALKKRFTDSETNVISGNLVFTDSADGAAAPVGAYWTYEKWIRRNESSLGCVPGATGACYALRRESFVRVPEQLVLDDVFIPMAACQDGGYCRFEPDSVIYDVPSSDMKQERLRKRRTIGGMFQLAASQLQWACPGGHPFWFSYTSHKVLRLTGPVLLLLACTSNLFLLCSPVYALFFGVQMAFYGLALAAPWVVNVPVAGSIASVARSFVVLNFVVPLGFWMWITGRVKPVWDRAYVAAGEDS